jgi:predicted nucleotidyltransferase component of viral defense system
MNTREKLALYQARGFREEAAGVNVLIEVALGTLFSQFPDAFVFFGGASIAIFYGSERHSADLDLIAVGDELPSAEQVVSALLAPLKEVAEVLGFGGLRIENLKPSGDLAKLAVRAEERVVFTIDITKIASVIRSELVSLRLGIDDENAVSVRVPSKNLELLFKAEAFLARRTLKARDAFDIKLLTDAGAYLSDHLKAHLSDGPGVERLEDSDALASRIAQVNARICRPELRLNLPDHVYRALEKRDFKPLREALEKLFANWL